MNTQPRRLRHAAALFGAATLAASTLTLLPGAARAQTAVTDPVGYLSIALPANSDTFVSIPFTRPAEFTGAVSVAPGSTGNVLTFSGTPFTGLTLAPLATAEPSPSTGHKTYYAIIGPKTAALTPTLSVTAGSATITASAAPEAVAGDTITVAGYTFTVVSVTGTTLTVDRVYPGTNATGLAATYNHSLSEGRFYTVTTNDSGTLTVNLNGDSLANVAAGTQVNLIPYWTFGTLFPSTDVGKSFLASVGTQARNRGTQFLIPDLASSGTNLAPTLIYYFYNGAWRQANDPVTTNPHDDDVLLLNTYFITRNANSTGVTAAPLTLVATGAVPVNRISTPLHVQSSTSQDDAVAVARPAPVTLNDLGLITSNAFVASTGTQARNRADQLFLYDNTATGTNKGAAAIYYYFNGGWRLAGDSTAADVGATVMVQPATGVTIRKAPVTGTVPTPFWQNPRNYLN